MRIDSSQVKILTADNQSDYKNTMSKLNVKNENFVSQSKTTQSNLGVTVELNTDNLEEVCRDGKATFAPVKKPTAYDVGIIDVGYLFEYIGLFNSKVSLEDIKKDGIDAFGEYRDTEHKFNEKSDIDEFLFNAAEKYSEILSQISEKYGDKDYIFNRHKDGLDRALRNYFSEKIHGIHIYAGIWSTSTNNEAYTLNSQETIEKFTENFDKDKDLKSQVDSALLSSFPEESTSAFNISLKDYKIIKETHELFFNKGTGKDIMRSLSQNQDLSAVIRKFYAGLLNKNVSIDEGRYLN